MSEIQQAPVAVQIRNSWHNMLPEEHILSRSRLYDLVPYEIGTPWCESLTGYINRLGWTSLPDTFKMGKKAQRKPGEKERERTPRAGPQEQPQRKRTRPFKQE